MNLIDFYKENDIREKKQTGTKKVEKTVDEETVTEEVPIYEYTYPITALSMSAIEGEMADALYRQFVVGGFTAQFSFATFCHHFNAPSLQWTYLCH